MDGVMCKQYNIEERASGELEYSTIGSKICGTAEHSDI